MPRKVYVRNQGEITLKDFIAAGGQGEVYAHNGYAYKIYHDPKQALPAGKIDELSILNHPNILRPLDPLLDPKTSQLIGYRMKEATNMVPLARYFNKTFKEKQRVTLDHTVKLVRLFQDRIVFVHGHHTLIVDVNELNFALTDQLDEMYFLDVDSYQTPHFPALALMDKVKDFHTKGFSELTDWYSFAIVSFNMFVGIHPYRGGHPDYKGSDKVALMVQRMKDNVSVFDRQATLPDVVLPFDVIPQVYLAWYKALFVEGKRLAPPLGLVETLGQIVTKVTTILSGIKLEISELATYGSSLVRYISQAGTKIVITTETIYSGKSSFSNEIGTSAITPKRGIPVAAHIDNNHLVCLTNIITQQEIPCTIAADQLISYDGRLYVKNYDKICEVTFIEGASLLATAAHVGNVLPKATPLFDGVVIQNLLGSVYAMVFPQPKTTYQIALKELNTIKIIDAKYENHVLLVLVNDGISYNKIHFIFNGDFSQYETWVEMDVDYHELNFVVLEHGVTVEILGDGKLQMYRNLMGAQRQIIEDPVITGDMKLFHDGPKLLFGRGNTLYSMTRK
jgi:hypothetical protein